MISHAAQQLQQIARGTLETVKNQPKELGEEALEQLGVQSPKSSPKSPKPPNARNTPEDAASQIHRLAELDKRQSAKQAQVLLQKIEDEIKQAHLRREQELQARRQPPRPLPEESAASSTAPLPDMTKNTPKRGGWLFGGVRRKIKSAFDQFSSEKRQGSGVGG